MEAVVTTLWTPRDGSSDVDFEDAFSPSSCGKHAGKRLRFAVADGATESLLSGPWARLLVHTWVGTVRRPASQLVSAARAEWIRQLNSYLEKRNRSDHPVQWYEEPGLVKGAHATFLGMQFTSRRTVASFGKWTAVGAGDSCLFHLRGGRLLRSFPVDSTEGFDCAPHLLASRPGLRATRLDATFGEWHSGDMFVLATDAFSRWFLSAHDAGSAVSELDRLIERGPEEFGGWVHERRRDRTLANDDVTVVAIECL